MERNKSAAQEANDTTERTRIFDSEVDAGSDPLSSTVDLRIRHHCPQCAAELDLESDSIGSITSCRACGALLGSSAQQAPILIPSEIGHFRLLQEVGAGGFGIVWKALDTTLERHVAIKLPRRQVTDRSELDQFLHEAKIVARLRHPNIVRVHEVGVHEATESSHLAYIVSDFVDGTSLTQWRQDEPRSWKDIARLVALVAQTLQHAHDEGIVHLDLKPGNIMIDRDGRHCVMDFGLARKLSENWRHLVDGTVMGTPAYMPPEQALGEAHRIGESSDVYSLGVILYELLTGSLPFDGTFAEVMRAVVEQVPIPPRQRLRQVPADLDAICMKCLRKEPEKRYRSPRELGDELARFVYDEPIRTRVERGHERFLRTARKNPRLALTGALSALLLLLLLLAGWWAFLDERQDRLRLEDALAQASFSRQLFLQTDDFRKLSSELENAANDPALQGLLQRTRELADLQPLLATLALQTRTIPAGPSARRKLIEHPDRIPLQEWLNRKHESGSAQIFSWLLLDPHGIMLARSPSADAIGRDYAWRTYFHGGPRDLYPHEPVPSDNSGELTHITETHLSAVLVTEVTERHAAVISTPIQAHGKFLGVLGIMIDLNEGGAVSSTSASQARPIP
jgi:eukaryotic-like serine/threonine-protein kinase